MVRIAPVSMTFNPRTLWFDAAGFDLRENDRVVVSTARGECCGTVSAPLFDLDDEGVRALKSPLKSVKRLATEEDEQVAERVALMSAEALPVFKQVAAETLPDIKPVAVEYLFGEEGKAVFYFESEDRVDFRDLVRRLASELHVRVDMKQIGVRDAARMVGGLGHCGQELCCRRFGSGFDPVSIRMAKEQDLSLNPQKISGMCGRLMCCLRYEYETYKDFHARSPKKNAKIQTPDGEGKVVDLNVPREIVSVKVGDEKPVKVPLADFDEAEEGARPTTVGQEAWSRASEPTVAALDGTVALFTNELTGEDKLAEPGSVRHVHDGSQKESHARTRSQKRTSRGVSDAAAKPDSSKDAQPQRKPRRRRSTTVSSDGAVQVSGQRAQQDATRDEKPPQPRRRSRRSSSSGAQGQQRQGQEQKKAQGGSAGASQGGSVQQERRAISKVGRNSSALRAGRDKGAQAASAAQSDGKPASGGRRRRRSHRSDTGGGNPDAQQNSEG